MKKNRVLWFSNTASNATNYLGKVNHTGSWITALENEIKKIEDVELAIAFPSRKYSGEFYYEGTKYYPILTETNKYKRFINRKLKNIEREFNVKKYLEIINDFKPDIIQIFGTESAHGLIQEHTDLPCVIHIQGILNSITRKYFSGLEFRLLKRYEPLIHKIKGSYFEEYTILEKMASREKKILKNSKYVIGRTRWDKAILQILAPNAKYFYCQEIIRKEFYTAKWELKSNIVCQLISVFNDQIYKGLETIIRTCLHFQNCNFQYNWSIIGVSDTSPNLRTMLRALKVNKKDINVEFFGPRENTFLIAKLLDSDMFIHCSHIENGCNAIAEAKLCGVPIIATAVGGVMTTINDNVDGLLFQEGDSLSLAGMITELYTNKAKILELSSNALVSSSRDYNSSNIANSLIQIYSEVIESHKWI